MVEQTVSIKGSTHVRESRIQQFFAVRIRNPKDWNPESTMVWNPESTIVWNPESIMVSILKYRKLESGIQRPGSGIQDLRGLSYMGRKGWRGHAECQLTFVHEPFVNRPFAGPGQVTYPPLSLRPGNLWVQGAEKISRTSKHEVYSTGIQNLTAV